MYYIYKISHLSQTNHVYIGQTNNPNRRFREHKSASGNYNNPCYDYPLYRAFRKYGIENFSFEVIDQAETEEIINQKEIDYISKYGYYNIADGGSLRTDMEILSKEASSLVREKIKLGIKYIDIAKEFNISITLISNINHGNRYFSPYESYPLINHSYKSKEDYSDVLELLTNSFLTFKEIAERTNCSEAMIKKINYGKIRKDLWSGSYPIRKINKHDYAITLLSETDLGFNEIAAKCELSYTTIKRINCGETRYNKQYSYPLRNL